ncbi:MAG: nitrilase family protein [Duncaniella sp.]|nr:nitrilase family protein [Duncaniella sp.]
MKICVLPLDIVYASPEENIVAVAHALSLVEPDTDVAVLPELFTTAFVADRHIASSLAESTDGPTITAVKRWAQFFGFAIAGSYLAKTGEGRCCNRAFFVEPCGDATYYDKRHLFPLSTEDKVYSPGSELPAVVRFRGWDLALTVCFDLRFPVWCRNNPAKPYDVMLVPSNWPHSRRHQYHTLLAARAIENQCYTVGANRIGTDDYGSYERSDSAIYSNLGEPIQETHRTGYLYAYIDRSHLDRSRERFPFLSAADRFKIEK